MSSSSSDRQHHDVPPVVAGTVGGSRVSSSSSKDDDDQDEPREVVSVSSSAASTKEVVDDADALVEVADVDAEAPRGPPARRRRRPARVRGEAGPAAPKKGTKRRGQPSKQRDDRRKGARSSSSSSPAKKRKRRIPAFPRKKKKTATTTTRKPRVIATTEGNLVGASSAEKPDEAYWEIDKIVDRRIVQSKVEFLVRWKGVPEDQSTWEPAANLCDTAFVEAKRLLPDGREKEKRRRRDEERLGLTHDGAEEDDVVEEHNDDDNKEHYDNEDNDNSSSSPSLPSTAPIDVGEEADDAWKWNDDEQLDRKSMERIHVDSPDVRKRVTDHRLNGVPFVLVGHKGWADFAKRWFLRRTNDDHDNNDDQTKNSASKNILYLNTPPTFRENLLPIEFVPGELDLDLSDPSLVLDVRSMLDDIGTEEVPVVRHDYNDYEPIKGSVPVSKFLRACWSNDPAEGNHKQKKLPRSKNLYLHQWQFPLSDAAGRKLGRRSAGLSDVLGEDLLCHWLDLPQCADDNPLQYLFMGREDTNSKLHCDNGGLAITIAPLVGRKECTLVHRLDGPCLYHLNASVDQPDLRRYPLLASARVWRDVLVPGEILFMPAGTYHQCRNLEPCLSYSRFHLDDVNLPPFLRSFRDHDALEIDHGEILWNACVGIMRRVERIADAAQEGAGRRTTDAGFRVVATARKLRHAARDVALRIGLRRAVKRPAADDEHDDGDVRDWDRLVTDLDHCLHEFRYRKYGDAAPPFDAAATKRKEKRSGRKSLEVYEDLKLRRGGNRGGDQRRGGRSSANDHVAYDTVLENAFVDLPSPPRKSPAVDISSLAPSDAVDVRLCDRMVVADVLDATEAPARAALLSYEEYPAVYDEWQFVEDLRHPKGDGTTMKDDDVAPGALVLHRDRKTEYRAVVRRVAFERMLRVKFRGMGDFVVDRWITAKEIVRKRPCRSKQKKERKTFVADKKTTNDEANVEDNALRSDDEKPSLEGLRNDEVVDVEEGSKGGGSDSFSEEKDLDTKDPVGGNAASSGGGDELSADKQGSKKESSAEERSGNASSSPPLATVPTTTSSNNVEQDVVHYDNGTTTSATTWV